MAEEILQARHLSYIYVGKLLLIVTTVYAREGTIHSDGVCKCSVLHRLSVSIVSIIDSTIGFNVSLTKVPWFGLYVNICDLTKL